MKNISEENNLHIIYEGYPLCFNLGQLNIYRKGHDDPENFRQRKLFVYSSFFYMPPSRATIYRWQILPLEIVDYYSYVFKLLNRLQSTVQRLVKELDYKDKWSTWIRQPWAIFAGS